MREDIKICLTRSAALAAVQSLVVWHEMGHFISLIEKMDGPRVVAGDRSEVYVTGRLNTGNRFSCFCVVTRRSTREESGFPIEHVLVSFDEACGKKKHAHYLCELSENGILFPQSWRDRPDF